MFIRSMFLTLILGLSFLLCSNNNLEAKLYIKQENVRLTKEGVLVAIDGNVFLTKSLNSDKKGFYVDSTALLQAKGLSKWWCPGSDGKKCGKWDHKKSKQDASCTDCGWPNGHRKSKKHNKKTR